MEPQNSNEPNNAPDSSNESSEGSIVIDHNPTSPQPQVIRPTVIQPSQQNEQPILDSPKIPASPELPKSSISSFSAGNVPTSTPSSDKKSSESILVDPDENEVLSKSSLPPKPAVQPINPHNPITTQPNVAVTPPVSPAQNPITTSAVTQPTVASTPASVPAIEPTETDGIDNPQWQYHSGKLKTEYEDYDNSYKTDEVQKDPQNAGIIWSASEFVSHQKNTKWYVLLGVGAIVVSGILYLVTREIFSIVVVVILAIALGVFGAVKPKTLDYVIGDDGIQIGPKQFPYTTFHSFAVIDDAAIAYIQLLPQKRFMAPISIYFAPEDEKKIVDYLGEHLPLEHKKRDFTDKLASRIHF